MAHAAQRFRVAKKHAYIAGVVLGTIFLWSLYRAASASSLNRNLSNLRANTENYVRAFNKRDVAALEALMAEDYTVTEYYHGVTPKREGRDQALGALKAMFDQNQNIVLRVTNIHVDPSDAVSILEFELTVGGTVLKGMESIVWEGSQMSQLRVYIDMP
eukprot:tig00000403_g323.t1